MMFKAEYGDVHASSQANHPEYLIRTCLHYDMLDFALEYTLSFMRKVNHFFFIRGAFLDMNAFRAIHISLRIF